MSNIRRVPPNDISGSDNHAPAAVSLCEAVIAVLPAYSLGTASEDERRLIEAALPQCPEAQAVLEDYRAISDSLLSMTPLNEAPPPIGSLLRRANAIPTAEPFPVRAPAAAQSVPLSRQLPTPEPALSGLPPSSQRADTIAQERQRRRFSLTTLALVASVAILAFINVYWIMQSQQLGRDQIRLLELIAAARPEQEDSLQLALNSSNHHSELAPIQTLSDQAVASFAWNSGTRVGALVVSGLPEISPDQTYQLWVVDSEHSLSLGTFSVNDDGSGVLVFQSPEPIENFEHIGVSTEPAGGSPVPTSEHLVIGNI